MLTRKAKREQTKRELAPSSPIPSVELGRIVREYRNRVRGATAFQIAGSPKKVKVPGKKSRVVVPSSFPADIAGKMLVMAGEMKKTADDLVPSMNAQLKQIPIYTQFLRNVFGFGPIVCGFLLSEIDIGHMQNGRHLRPSGLRRFCGYAVIGEGLERPTRGQKLGYCAELRTRIWQAFQAMRRNAAKKTADAPNGVTNKYLDLWYNTKIASIAAGMRKGAADSKGRNKATDLFLLDLYTVWRAIEGLPVYPSYYERKLGEGHRGWEYQGGDDSRLLTVEEAFALVGDYGTHPLPAERVWGERKEEDEDDGEEAA